ncbi:hypothetical protein GOP47_0012787 [Adiantum capillus-veneris]|uniref:Uncharacterized protein n=1 Tax=Adiantum capillus-veneris TaxID=13818 RepID=A0A9D4URK2_ADICA|nr:hypothetical protein GOP47_0012787 [Adiantum capillus-veneris]
MVEVVEDMEEASTTTATQGLWLHQIQLQHIKQIKTLREEEATIKEQEEETMEEEPIIATNVDYPDIGKGIARGIKPMVGHKSQMDQPTTMRYLIMYLQVQNSMMKLCCLLTWLISKKN